MSQMPKERTFYLRLIFIENREDVVAAEKILCIISITEMQDV